MKHTHTHKHTLSTEPQYFYNTVRIFLHTKFTSTHLILCKTYQSLSGSKILSPDSHFKRVNIKISATTVSHRQHTKSQEIFFGKNASEWARRVEISKKEIPGSRRSIHCYIQTCFRLYRENLCALDSQQMGL